MGACYYKTLEDPKTWILVTDNGGAYKVDAEYMIWYTTKDGRDGSQAIWSTKALRNSIKSLMTKGTTVSDPGYQT